MKGKGFKIQGSDISTNKNIERLKKEKIKVLIGHKKQPSSFNNSWIFKKVLYKSVAQ